MLNSPQPQPNQIAIDTVASRGDLSGLIAALKANPELKPSPEALRVGFEQAHLKVRNGYSDQMIVDFLLSGVSPSESAEMLARKGLVGATLLASIIHTEAHRENDPVVISREALVEGYEKALPRVRNGYSDQMIVDFLLLGVSPSESAEMLAREGFVAATLLASKSHTDAHRENDPVVISRDALVEGYERALPTVRNGYSDQMIVDFLLSGLLPSESAEMLARKGFVGATLLAAKSHTDAHPENDPIVLPEDAVAQGFEEARLEVRNGYSEEEIVRFALLSPDRGSFFLAFARNGFLKSAYLLKLAAGLEQKLSDDDIEDCLSVMEARPYNGLDRIIPDLQEKLVVAKGGIPAALTPELMLQEVCQNPQLFTERLQNLRTKDTGTLGKRLNGDSWNPE